MFVAISFGPKDESSFTVPIPEQYWNQITYHSSKHLAERWALDQLPIGGCIGYVIIKTGKDAWCVWDEVGTENVTISQVGSFFSVQPAPRLVMV